ncbi:MAG: type IV secretion system DNA-binding domain-containing protein [Candidatus Gracilibacteria bacterium]|nr:type IV secretion system DNA-binding domain-containing protein [Candidatus Gracilibacteria bacterium]
MKKTKKTVLRLAVPRMNERGPMAFEQILASLHGLLSREMKRSGDESVSFEIAQVNGKIHFYIVCPGHLRTLISSQFFAQYPSVEIETVPNYFVKKLINGKKVLATSLEPYNPWVFPFKRHPQFDDSTSREFEDPLGAITSAISHLNHKSDAAVVQFVIKPVGSRWEEAAENALQHYIRGGLWRWNSIESFYQWARLNPKRWVRLARAPIWRLIHLFLGWSGKMFSGGRQDRGEDEGGEMDERTSSSRHDRETVYSAAFDKISRLAFATNIRMLYVHSDDEVLHAEAKLREIAGTFHQFDLPQLNKFDVGDFARSQKSKLFRNIIERRADDPFILSQEELATMFHLPTKSVTTPKITWVDSPKLEPPTDLPDDEEKDITILGETNFRNAHQKYGLRVDDRRRHVYIIGKTGMGKSTLLENMIFSDIQEGKGVAVVDPHGDLAEAVLRFVPKKRTNDVILFDPADREFPVAFNLLEGKNAEQRGLVASGLIGVIKKLNIDSWGPRLEHFLRNTILALVEAPDTTMLGITRMLVDKDYRYKILHYVEDPMVKSFWQTEFSALAPQKLAEAVGPIQNKVGQFLATPVIRNIVGQPKSTLDLRFAMDTGKIVIVNLSKGKLGEDNSAMLGSLLITKFQLDAMSRADIPQKDRRDFYLYVDEFQNFATDSFASILSEARKYRLNLTMANQYIAQMSEEVAAAVFGNVGTLVSFQVGIDDAKILSEQFDEERVTPINIASIPKYQVYNRVMVEGITSPVFSANTLPPPEITEPEDPEERMKKIRNFSRQRYAKPRSSVEEKIMRWTRPEENKRKKKGEEKNGESKSEKKTPPTSSDKKKK